MKKNFIGIVIVVIIVIAIVYILKSPSQNRVPETLPTPTAQADDTTASINNDLQTITVESPDSDIKSTDAQINTL